MEIYCGKSVYNGIAIGKIHLLSEPSSAVSRLRISDVPAEIVRFQEAKTEASHQLSDLYEKTVREVGQANAAIFEIHAMMLEDADYITSIENIIRTQSVNAEYAVSVTGDNFSKMFLTMDDEYMQARSADVRDISDRIIRILLGVSVSDNPDEPSIILADDLAPSRTVQLDKKLALSFVTVHGSSNSHTAILARTLNIPSIIGCKIEITPELNGRIAIADGHSGRLIIDPDDETLGQMNRRRLEDENNRRMLGELKGKPTVTSDGRLIRLYANIGSDGDLASVFRNDAEGIGLFRSEFIYLGRNSYPSEEEQFSIYKKVAETMAGKPVIIRTLDIGADKKADYFQLGHEENPAMGFRAIRICLSHPEVFRTQLRAIFRAGAYGSISVMYPMITSLGEIRRIKEITDEVKAELRAENIEYADIPQGIMIETPAAAIISDILADEVDFFSIGTNDLTQYTLAADRQNDKIDGFYEPHHPAVLRLIERTVKNAHKSGIWCGICGELGADTKMTETFIRMGIDELSVAPSAVLPVRLAVRKACAGYEGAK